MRKIKWLIVYPAGLIATALLHRLVDLYTISVMVLVTVFLLLFDLARNRRRL